MPAKDRIEFRETLGDGADFVRAVVTRRTIAFVDQQQEHIGLPL